MSGDPRQNRSTSPKDKIFTIMEILASVMLKIQVKIWNIVVGKLQILV